MRLIAFVDCETSGLRKNHLTEDDQPYLLQIACTVVDEDNNTVSSFSRIIRPEGWAIEPEAEAVHGISAAYASRVGIDLFIAMIELRASIATVDEIAGWNIQGFDRSVITDSIKRCKDANGLPCDPGWWLKVAPKIVDLMEIATPILKLPGQYGYKFPKLDEAVRHFGSDDNDYYVDWKQTHRADEDVEAMRWLYWMLRGISIRGAAE